MIHHAILDLLFPRKCVLCGKLLEREETDICHGCRAEAPWCVKCATTFSFLDSWAAVWYYKGYIRDSLHRFKFGGARHYADVYGRFLAMRLTELYPDGFDLLTWVPVSSLRRFRRGYDQVELLARSVGREMGLQPTATLRKVRNNRPQSGIEGAAQRKANVLGAYQVLSPDAVAGKRILLLDDIITTGATAGECARVLLTAGAREIHCGCVAAAQHHK